MESFLNLCQYKVGQRRNGPAHQIWVLYDFLVTVKAAHHVNAIKDGSTLDIGKS